MLPTFTIYTGPMYGSKSTRLIGDIDRYTRRRRLVLAYKPQIDNRYDEGKICTHSGASVDAKCVSTGEDVLKHVNTVLHDYDNVQNVVVAVDEAFMIDGIAKALIEIYKKGITVIVSSIQLSANFKPFEEIMYMMPYATKIEICPAVCAVCSEDAYYTFSKFEVGHDPVIGGNDLYEPRSFKHYPPIRNHD